MAAAEDEVTVDGLLESMAIVIQWLRAVSLNRGVGDEWIGLVAAIEALRVKLVDAARDAGVMNYQPPAPPSVVLMRSKGPGSNIGVPC
jgi:hypothetical protein